MTGVKNGDQAVNAENLEGNAVKGTSQIIKSQESSTVKGQPDTKSHQSTIPHLVEQVQSRSKDYLKQSRPKIQVKFFDPGRGCLQSLFE